MQASSQKTSIITVIFIMLASVSLAQSFTVQSPEDNSFLKNDTINISVKNETDVHSANYTLKGPETDTSAFLENKTGILSNQTDQLEEGKFDLNITAKVAGSWELKERNFTIDRTKPSIDIVEPGGQYFNSGFHVNATYSDEFSPLKTPEYSFNDSGPTGNLNDTIDSGPLDSDTTYEINYSVEDEAGNIAYELKEIVFDDIDPSFQSSNIESKDWVNDTFYLDSVWSSYSPIDEVSYVVENSTSAQIASGTLNTTVSIDQEDDLTVDITATDKAGNENTKTISSISSDLTKPSINITNPTEDVVQGFFGVNGTYSDSGGSGVGTLQVDVNGETYDLNYTVNSSNLSDGDLGLEVEGVDKAGNVESEVIDLSVDNNPPEIDDVSWEGVSLDDEDYLPGEFDLDIDAEDEGTSVETYYYRMQGDYQQSNDSEISFNLNEGSYNLSLNVSDESNNWNNVTYLEDLNVDATQPTVDYSLDNYTGDWIKDGLNADVSCSDDDSGNVEIALYRNGDILNSWSQGDSRTFTLTGDGEESFEFHCRDSVGNTVESDEEELNIDSTTPEVENSTPEDGSEGVQTRTTFDFVFNQGSLASGLNENESGVKLYGEGEVNDVDWLPDAETGSASIQGLNPYQNYALEVTLQDNVGHNSSTNITFETGDKVFRDEVTGEGSLQYGISTVNLEAIAQNGSAVIEYQDSKSLSTLNMTAKQDLENLSISAQELSGPSSDSPDFEGLVYSYAQISSPNSDSVEIENIEFNVNNSWLNRTGLSDSEIDLFSLDENSTWTAVNASVVSQNVNRYNYRAEPENFSGYVIGAENIDDQDGSSRLLGFLNIDNLVSVLLTVVFLLSFFYFLLQLMDMEVDIDSKFKIRYTSREE